MVNEKLKEMVKKTNYGISSKACRIGFKECKDKIIKLIDKLENIEGGNISGIINADELKEELLKLKPEFAQ